MLSVLGKGARLCDGVSRREAIHVGGLSALGLSLPQLLGHHRADAASEGKEATLGESQLRTGPAQPRAKSCIILFLMGGPPQHSTWDPKPNAPAEIRGEFAPVSTTVPGLQICELLPKTARLAEKFSLLRAVSTNDNAHSSSGYAMLTGRPHQPMNFENANPGFPNDFPSMGGIVRALERRRSQLPASLTLPHHIFNTNGSVWPGQDAGFLGRADDPWLIDCQPASPSFDVEGLSLPEGIPPVRLERRRSLLEQLSAQRAAVERSGRLEAFDADMQQAFELLTSTKAGSAFELDQEPASVRDWYGRSQFGQSVLLARRLIESEVKLVQVNWYRGPDEPPENPCWDSHVREAQRLRTVLAPAFDCAYAALLGDLSDRGLLDETLVVCMAEFGRSPRINSGGGRDHWGSVFSLALAGGGVRGGEVYGASDAIGGEPAQSRIGPQDITATVFDSLGYAPHTLLHDRLGRPVPLSRGEPVSAVF